MALTPATDTFTTASAAFAGRTGTSSSSITSGPPVSCTRIAFMVFLESSPRLGDQQQLSSRLPCFQIPMCPLRLSQRIAMFNSQLEFSGSDHSKHDARPLHQLFARGDVVRQRRPGQKQRSLL